MLVAISANSVESRFTGSDSITEDPTTQNGI